VIVELRDVGKFFLKLIVIIKMDLEFGTVL